MPYDVIIYVLTTAFVAAISLCILYLIIRIAVRNGILDAHEIIRTQSDNTANP